MKRMIVFFLSVWLIAQGVYASPKLEDILSSPFPSSLISATAKDRIAWVFNDQGRRNVWVADGPNYQPRRLTNYQEDDGQELGSLVFTPDAETILYVRGGAPNDKQENPNPSSNPKGMRQEVWSIAAKGGEPVLIGAGSTPAISTSNTVVFVKNGQIFSNSLQNPKEATQLFHARGVNASPVWSPDGSQLAFVSGRGDHGFIGIYDLSASKITWMAPDVDIDFAPVWSPDGKQIAYFRFPGQRAEAPPTWEPSSPFSIWIADPQTGAGKEVWKSNDQTGGFAQFYPDPGLAWSADNRLVFYWETDGWMRLYSVSTSGGKAVALSPASCEAEAFAWTTDRKRIVFVSNCDDIERRHLWIVPAAGGAAKKITQGSGAEWSPVVTGNNEHIVYVGSTSTQPAAPTVIAMNGGTSRLLAPEMLASVPVSQIVTPQTVIFKSMDGLDIHGQLFLPAASAQSGKHPALIFMHGGPIRQMLPVWHYMDYYHNAYGMNQYLAANGYVVLSVNFRCGIGYGRNFRRAPRQGPYGASEYQDIVAGARFLQKRPEVDPDRIGLWGGSYGGYLTAMGLSRDSQLFAAGVDFHGVHDWALRARLRGAGDWGIRGDEMMRVATDSSPVGDISSWTSPVLFIIGDDDRNVDFIETTDLVQRLREEGKAHVETLIFPDEVHDLLCFSSWIKAYRATLDFFNRHLL